MFRNPRLKTIMLAVGALVFLAFTGGVTFLVYTRYFVDGGQSTESRSRASSAAGTVKLTLETDSNARYVKDTFPIRVYLDTAGKAVSGVAFGLSYDSGTAAVPDLEVVDSNTTAGGVQIESKAKDLDPCFGQDPQVNQISRTTAAGNKKVFIDYSAVCANTTGYTSPATGKVLIATIWLKANAVGTGTFLIEHDPTKAIAVEKSSGNDILQTVSPISFTIAADTAKPVVSIVSGLAEGASTASGRVRFSFSGVDQPTRPADLLKPDGYLQYSYVIAASHTTTVPGTTAFGSTNAAGTFVANTWTNSPDLNIVLPHGNKTLFVRVRDLNGNVSDVVRRQFILNLTPFVESATPVAGPEQTEVTLTGYNFGTTKGVIKMGTVTVPAASITVWTNEQIKFKVPITANGDITVQAVGTPTFSAGKPFKLETRLAVTYIYQGITSDRGARKVDVAIYKGATKVAELVNQNAVWSTADNAYKVTTDPLPDTYGLTTGFAATGHTVSLKDGTHLRRKFTAQTITRGKLNPIVKKAAADKLVIGDFNNDNKLDISDFGLMMTQVKALSNAVDANNGKYDVNGDGVISIPDIGLLLTNYTALQVPGDTQQ